MSSAPFSAETWGPGYGGGLGAGVLLVEDDPGFGLLVRSMIEETSLSDLGFEHVELLAQARDYLLEVGAGCVLLDLTLPDARRLKGLEALRATDPDVPIVVLTGSEDDALAAEAVAAGAQDYLVKGHIDGYHLAHAVRYAIERQRRERALADERLHDPLTGLPTAPLLADRVQVAISRARRDGSFFALLLLGLHDLSEINHRYGHATGDAVLTRLARRSSTLCPWDTIARDGGRLFILCEDLETPDDAMTLAGYLGTDFRENGFEAGGLELSDRLRIGFAAGDPGVTHVALIQEAEATLGRLTEDCPPPAPAPASVVGPKVRTQLEALREEIDSGIADRLSLEEIEVLLDGKTLPEEIRDAAWLYAWALLEQRADRRGARTC
jgi:diguanylate cyclase (GGDEF)-like protein